MRAALSGSLVVAVADAVHRHDGPRLFGRQFHLFPQLRYMLVERAGGAEVIDAPPGVEQRVPREHLARMRREHLGELHFPRGERGGPARPAPTAVNLRRSISAAPSRNTGGNSGVASAGPDARARRSSASTRASS